MSTNSRYNSPEDIVADAIGHYGVIHIALPMFPQYAEEMQKYVDILRKHATPKSLLEVAKANGQNTEAEWFLRLQQHVFNER